MTVKVRLVNQNWWITTLLVGGYKHCPPLTQDIKCDVLIVGGGFSGVAAAAEFLRKGLKVVLIEKNIIGGSSSGRSAGMLTPDSELELHQLVRRYGAKAAGEIWEAPLRGIERIVDVIKKHDIQCGLQKQDSLFLGLGSGGAEDVEHELESRKLAGFTDQRTYDVNELKGFLGSQGYTAGIVMAIGCFVGGWLCDRIHPRTAYALIGLGLAVVAAGMALSPKTVGTYVAWSLVYVLGVGLAYAAFTAVVLNAIGWRSAATKYNLFASLSNYPIWWLGLALGRIADVRDPDAMLLAEAGFAVVAVVAFLLATQLVRRTPLPETLVEAA